MRHVNCFCFITIYPVIDSKYFLKSHLYYVLCLRHSTDREVAIVILMAYLSYMLERYVTYFRLSNIKTFVVLGSSPNFIFCW
jgi:hypothetical protein